MMKYITHLFVLKCYFDKCPSLFPFSSLFGSSSAPIDWIDKNAASTSTSVRSYIYSNSIRNIIMTHINQVRFILQKNFPRLVQKSCKILFAGATLHKRWVQIAFYTMKLYLSGFAPIDVHFTRALYKIVCTIPEIYNFGQVPICCFSQM